MCLYYQSVSSMLAAVGFLYLGVVVADPFPSLIRRGLAVPDWRLLLECPQLVNLIEVDAVGEDALAPVGSDLGLRREHILLAI